MHLPHDHEVIIQCVLARYESAHVIAVVYLVFLYMEYREYNSAQLGLDANHRLVDNEQASCSVEDCFRVLSLFLKRLCDLKKLYGR